MNDKKTIETHKRIEALRLILEGRQGRPVTYDEAREISVSLVSFYQLLGAKESSTL